MTITALAGGVGASKLLLGLSRVQDPASLTVVANTGDDIELDGLWISPDLDIVTYTLARVVSRETGWGIDGDTFAALETLGRYGRATWFNLGDRDLATHIHRTALLRSGRTLSEAAESIRQAWGVRTRILPMSDQPVPTIIETPEGSLNFQEYLVMLRARPVVRGIVFEGVDRARPAPGVLESLERSSGIVICPSNPLISIGPILAVPGIREVLRDRRQDVIAVSPLVQGKSLKGPSDKMLRELGYEVSALGVARNYRDVAGSFVLDSRDASLAHEIESLGMSVVVGDTVMHGDQEKENLASLVVAHLENKAARVTAEARNTGSTKQS
jgi:LPPG:FO 2-phospho-L-lactate transferase